MSFLNLTEKREELVYPLLKWRILGINELSKLSKYEGSERGMRKMVERLENDGVLDSFIHKLSRRKFVYLTREAYKELTTESWNINTEIKMHDAVVSLVLYRFSKFKFVDFVKINDQNIEVSSSIFSHGLDADGMIRASRRESISNIAIEIELTRKSSERIFKKFKLYHDRTSFDWVIYIFKSKLQMKVYFNYYQVFLVENKINLSQARIMFCSSSSITSADFCPLESRWLRPDGVESTLGNFFYVQ